MQANNFKRSLIALTVVGAFGVGAVTAERAGTFKLATAANQPAVVAVAPSATSAALPDFADLVAQNGPAVVQISVTKDAQKVVARGFPSLAVRHHIEHGAAELMLQPGGEVRARRTGEAAQRHARPQARGIRSAPAVAQRSEQLTRDRAAAGM